MEQKMFTKKDLVALLVPLMIEQILNALMGTLDTVMVSNVSDVALSAVSLVNSINNLVIQVFSALAAGGTVVCAQYIGRKEMKRANESAGQLQMTLTAISVVLTGFCLLCYRPLLSLIFGRVDASVMEAAIRYFLITACSFPFVAVYNGSAALFRAQGNSRFPMTVSMISNVINVAGNAILIFGLHMGVTGAALSTLFARVFCAVVVTWALRDKKLAVSVKHYLHIRPDRHLIWMILLVAVPTGIENGMFQFGKLAIQSTVSLMGTTAIAAQALVAMLEEFSSMASIGICLGLVTIVGQCVGAGRVEEAKSYCMQLMKYAEIGLIISGGIIMLITFPLTSLSAMNAEGRSLCIRLMLLITVVKPFIWKWSFVPPYAMRAAGDARYCLIVSSLTMWLCRVSLCMLLVRGFGFGPLAVWIGMFSDWGLRGLIFRYRFNSGKWVHLNMVH
ncbi:MAG: MATE family efflux transporter [Lachnospiraceae bacterium]|nr:MATE family efflux transporter [Lachnospiraceae bacterium]